MVVDRLCRQRGQHTHRYADATQRWRKPTRAMQGNAGPINDHRDKAQAST
jgi:hypothetical protein